MNRLGWAWSGWSPVVLALAWASPVGVLRAAVVVAAVAGGWLAVGWLG